MNCPYCGTSIQGNQIFCPKCGNRIINHIITENYELSDTRELELYIDKNYKKISNKAFSFPTFFLSVFYFFYRKMYLLAFFFAILNISICFFAIINYKIALILLVGTYLLSFIIAIKFNSIYINFANHKINKIKKKHFQLSNYEIDEKIKDAGGTNLLSPVLFLTILLFFNFFSVKYFKFNQIDLLSNNDYLVSSNINTNALMKLNLDKSFIWYKDKDNKSDNYYVGTYNLYNNKLAIKKSTEFNINTNNIKNNKNYYIIEFNINRTVLNGVSNISNDKIIYYGIYDTTNDSIDLNNVNGQDYFRLIKIKE